MNKDKIVWPGRDNWWAINTSSWKDIGIMQMPTQVLTGYYWGKQIAYIMKLLEVNIGIGWN